MNKYDELERLQNLKLAGSLTDEEFEKEKKKILGTEIIQDEQKGNGLSIAGFVLGIVSFILGGLITGIVGIVLSAKAKHKAKQEGRKDEKAIIGLIFSIIGVVKASIAIIILGLCFLFAVSNETIYYDTYEEPVRKHVIQRDIEIDGQPIESIINDFFNE